MFVRCDIYSQYLLCVVFVEKNRCLFCGIFLISDIGKRILYLKYNYYFKNFKLEKIGNEGYYLKCCMK